MRLPLCCSLLASLFVLLLGASCAPAPTTADTPTASSSFGLYETAPSYDGWSRSSVYVPMPDGVRIAVDYYLPSQDGVTANEPLPVVLHYTRYIRAFEGEDGQISSPVRIPLNNAFIRPPSASRICATTASSIIGRCARFLRLHSTEDC